MKISDTGSDAPGAGRSWEAILPPGLKLPSLNDRVHWSARNSMFQSVKKAAWAMIRNARVPALSRVTVLLVFDPPDRRRRDADNLAGALKACCDAMVAAGVVPDDSSRYVARASCEISETIRPGGRVRFIITEAPGGGS